MIVPYVFPAGAAAFLGIDMPTVGVGEAVFPVLTSVLAVGVPAEGIEQAETTGSWSADVLSPARLQASFFLFPRRPGTVYGHGQQLAGKPQHGPERRPGPPDHPWRQRSADRRQLGQPCARPRRRPGTSTSPILATAGVDGRYAETAAALRILMGTGSYADAGLTYRAPETDETAPRAADADHRRRAGLGPRARRWRGNKQNGLIRLGMRRDMVAPIWENVAIIPDEITKADEGQIKITAVMLHAVKILRVAGFYKQEVNVS